MMEMIGQFRWQDGVDIGIITFLIYRLLQILRGSRAMQMIIGLAVILVVYVSSRALGLFTLNWIIDNFLGSIILVIIVIFQSDIRRALTQVGTAPLFGAAERMAPRSARRDRGNRRHRGRHFGARRGRRVDRRRQCNREY